MKYRLAALLIALLLCAQTSACAEQSANTDERYKTGEFALNREKYEVDYHNVTTTQYAQINAYDAWELFGSYVAEHGCAAVKVGLIDTGFYEAHPDLRFADTLFNKDSFELLRSYSYLEREQDDYSGDGLQLIWDLLSGEDPLSRLEKISADISLHLHGTMTASLLGAVRDNGIGIDGMYPLACAQVTGDDGQIRYESNMYGYAILEAPPQRFEESGASHDYNALNTGWYIAGLKYMLESGVKVINISMGSTREDIPAERENGRRIAEYLQGELDAGRDFLIVTAAGNEDINTPEAVNPFAAILQAEYPEVYARVIVVAANYTAQNTLCDFSNYGPRIDLTAPGDEMMVAAAYGYTLASGTSMAAPLVAGAAAMMWTVAPNATGVDIADMLAQTAQPVIKPSFFDFSVDSYKLLDAYAALQQAINFAGDIDYSRYPQQPAVTAEPFVPFWQQPEGGDTADEALEAFTAKLGLLSLNGLMQTGELAAIRRSADNTETALDIYQYEPSWGQAELTGLLAADIYDYDGDGALEMLTVSFASEPLMRYGMDALLLRIQLTMYEYSAETGEVHVGAVRELPVGTAIAATDLLTEQLNVLRAEGPQGTRIILDDFRAANGDEVSLAAYAYDGETGEINYAAGCGLYAPGEGGVYVYGMEAESGEYTLDCAGALRDNTKWRLITDDARAGGEAEAYEAYRQRVSAEFGLAVDDRRLSIARGSGWFDSGADFGAQLDSYALLDARDVYGGAVNICAIRNFYSMAETPYNGCAWWLFRRDYTGLLDMLRSK